MEVTVGMEAKKPILRAHFLTGSGVMHTKVHYRKRTCRGNWKIGRLEPAEHCLSPPREGFHNNK